MSQLSLFDTFVKKKDEMCSEKKYNYWKLFIDGASRNNPGPAGAGIVLIKDDDLVKQQGFYLGTKTNNQAEYLALVIGLFYIQKQMCKDDLIVIVSDSQLLVRQIKGEYRVKNALLKPLFSMATDLLKNVSYDIVHVLREENKQADAMANQGIDKKRKLPGDFLDFLHKYEVSI